MKFQGACLSLLAVKVYHLTCPETTVGYAYYPETPTGAELTSVEKINGKCVDNALAVSEPYNLCKGEGTWAYPSGRCACMAGYEANEVTQTCNACPVGRFKHNSGEGPCLICPPHSQVTRIFFSFALFLKCLREVLDIKVELNKLEVREL